MRIQSKCFLALVSGWRLPLILVCFCCPAQRRSISSVTLVTYALTFNSSQTPTVSLAAFIMNEAACRLPPLRNWLPIHFVLGKFHHIYGEFR